MKLTKSQLKQFIKEELLNEIGEEGQSGEWEDEGEFKAGDFVEVEIYDDGYDGCDGYDGGMMGVMDIMVV